MGIFKRTTSLLMILVMLLSLTGCERSFWKDPNAPVVEPVQAAKDAPRIPGELKYAWINPVEIRSAELSEDYRVSYPIISGLADEDVCAAINERLLDLGLGLFPDDTERSEDDADLSGRVEILFNVNDILSAKASLFEVDGDTEKFLAADYYTVNLRNGKIVALSELFERGFEYSEIIDSRISENFSEEGLSGFSGISADQPFYLDQEGLHIILSDDQDCMIGFDAFDDKWLIADGCSGSYYTDPTLSYGVILSQNDCRWIEEETSDNMDREDLWISEHVRYPSTASPAMMEGIQYIRDLLAPDKEELFSKVKQSRAKSKVRNTSVVWSTDISCSKIGDYSVVHGEFVTNSREDYWEIEHYDHVYGGDGVELELSDMFDPSFDYMSFLKEKLDYMMETVYANYTFPEDFDPAAILEDLSFRVDYDALYVETKPVVHSIESADGTVTSFSEPLLITVNYYELTSSQLAVYGKNN